MPEVDFAKFGPIERQAARRASRRSPVRGCRRAGSTCRTSRRSTRPTSPSSRRRARTLKDEGGGAGIKLTPLAFILRACVKALQEFPQFATSLDAAGGELVLKKYVHLGFAADTPNGLVVPVIRDADRKDVYELARELAALSREGPRRQARPPAEMQGGSFTVSSLGGIGGTSFTPIINAPEVAILGVSRSAQRPVYKDGSSCRA